MIRFPLAAILLAAMIMPAAAADLIEEPLPIYEPPVYDWNGWYAGFSIGGGWGNAHTTSAFFDYDNPLAGGIFGVDLGWNYQVDNFVLGIEGDISWTNISGLGFCGPGGLVSCDTNIDWLSTLRGRAGFAADRALYYVTGGLAGGGVTTTAAAPFTGSVSTTQWGWVIGAGAEWAFSDTMTLRGEILHADLGSAAQPLTGLGFTDRTVAVSTNIIRAGFNFRF